MTASEVDPFRKSNRGPEPATLMVAFAFTIAVLALGYMSFGFWTMLIFTSGFAGGFALWCATPCIRSFRVIRTPFFLALTLFAAHRVEEYASGFFATLASITGVDTPDTASWQVVALLLVSVGAWLAVPFAAGRSSFGNYFAWTFFAAMGVTELAHILVFPWFTQTPFAYFPGMLSVLALAPVAWWGMWRIFHQCRSGVAA